MRVCPSSARWRTADRAPAVLVDRDDQGAAARRGRRGDDRDAQVQAAHQLQDGDVVDDQDDRLDPLAEQAVDDGADPRWGRRTVR